MELIRLEQAYTSLEKQSSAGRICAEQAGALRHVFQLHMTERLCYSVAVLYGAKRC